MRKHGLLTSPPHLAALGEFVRFLANKILARKRTPTYRRRRCLHFRGCGAESWIREAEVSHDWAGVRPQEARSRPAIQISIANVTGSAGAKMLSKHLELDPAIALVASLP